MNENQILLNILIIDAINELGITKELPDYKWIKRKVSNIIEKFPQFNNDDQREYLTQIFENILYFNKILELDKYGRNSD